LKQDVKKIFEPYKINTVQTYPNYARTLIRIKQTEHLKADEDQRSSNNLPKLVPQKPEEIDPPQWNEQKLALDFLTMQGRLMIKMVQRRQASGRTVSQLPGIVAKSFFATG
jgi:hypothetical protein